MKFRAEIGEDRRAPSAGFNRIRFQGLSLNPALRTLSLSNVEKLSGYPWRPVTIILATCAV
jgi:hypothetical protein